MSPKTVSVARQAWTRLAEFGLERGDVVVGLGGGGAADRRRRVRGGHVPARCAVDRGADLADRHGGCRHRWQNRVSVSLGQNFVGAFHQAEMGDDDPAVLETLPVCTRVGVAVQRGDQDRSARGWASGTWCSDGRNRGEGRPRNGWS